MPSFTPYHFNHPGNQMKLRLWKPWRARGQWGTRNVTLGWYATREEAEEVERQWREDSAS